MDIRRVRRGKGFAYYRGSRRVADERTLERIRKLGVPPAYEDVRIANSASAKVQATAVDARGRTQRRYLASFTQKKSDEKFERLADLSGRLPSIRAKALRMASPLISGGAAAKRAGKEALVGAAVLLMDRHGIRAGSEKYLDENGSVGLTTLHPTHVKRHGRSGAVLRFVGKSGKDNELVVTYAPLAKAILTLKGWGGDRLFRTYEGSTLAPRDVNDWLKEHGEGFVGKDLRTWRANAAWTEAVLSHETVPESAAAAKRAHSDAVRRGTDVLGNTPAVFKRNYLHGGLSQWYVEDPSDFVREARKVRRARSGMSVAETRLARMLTYDL